MENWGQSYYHEPENSTAVFVREPGVFRLFNAQRGVF